MREPLNVIGLSHGRVVALSLTGSSLDRQQIGAGTLSITRPLCILTMVS